MSNIDSWDDLIKANHQFLQRVANSHEKPAMTAADALAAKLHLLKQAQDDSFSEKVQVLATGKPISKQSCLYTLAPEYDSAVGLIRVGGRLWRAEGLDPDAMHPIILDPKHHVTIILIKEHNNKLLHSGPERVFSKIRRTYRILRGTESVKRHQYSCGECQRFSLTEEQTFEEE